MYKVVITRTDGVQMEFNAIDFRAACSLIAGVTAAVVYPLASWVITPLNDQVNEKK